MHFKTLVTVYMPTVEEDPHENAAVRQSIELLQAQKDELAKNLMAEITLCSLMGRTTNFARQLVSAVEEVMTPYSTEPPEEYMEFADMTEELKADYAKSVDCLKLRFLYKGIIIKHNKTEPTYTKTSLFLCEKRRFFMGRTEKGGKVF